MKKTFKIFILAFILVSTGLQMPEQAFAQACSSIVDVSLSADFSVSEGETVDINWNANFSTYEPTGGRNIYLVELWKDSVRLDYWDADTNLGEQVPESGFFRIAGFAPFNSGEYRVTASVISEISCPNGATDADEVTVSIATESYSCSITALDMTPPYNTGTTLYPSITGSYSWNISLLAGTVSPTPSSGSGSNTASTGNLTDTHIYELTCSFPGQTMTQSVTVNPDDPAAATCTDPSATNYGATGNCTYPSAPTCTEPGAANYGGSGDCTYPPPGTPPTATCTNSNASNYGEAGECVIPPGETCANPDASNYGGALPCVITGPLTPSVSTPSCVPYGSSYYDATISWAAVNNNINIFLYRPQNGVDDHWKTVYGNPGSTTAASGFSPRLPYTPALPGLVADQTYSLFISNGGADGGTVSWSIGQCEAPLPPTTDPTGTITANSSCGIPAGANSCIIPVSWNTVNPQSGYTSVITTSLGGGATGNSGTNIEFTVPYGIRTLTLSHNNVTLDQETLSSSCVSGTSWNGSTCVTLSANSISCLAYNSAVRNCSTTEEYWAPITSSGPEDCMNYCNANNAYACSWQHVNSACWVIITGSGCSLEYNFSGWSSGIQNTSCTAPSPSGTITPSSLSCPIAAGASSCSVVLTWETLNPIGTSAITAVGMADVVGNSGSQAFSIPYGGRTFYLYNNAQELDREFISASTADCVSGTTWNGSTCQNQALNYSLSNSGTSSVTKTSGIAYTQNTITKTLISGSPASVSLTLSGVPNGVSYSISNSTCSPTCSSTITFSVTSSATVGNHTITVTGSPLGKTTSFTLAVSGAPITVTCAASPSTALIGQSVDWTATVGGGIAPLSYSWSGSSISSAPAPSTNPYTHVYNTIGQKTAQVTVTDSDGVSATCPAATLQVNFNPNFEEF